MSCISQRLVQSPEAADKTFGIHRDRFGEITALRGYSSDNGYASFGSVEIFHHACSFIEGRQTGSQIGRETFLCRHLFQTAGEFTEGFCPTGGGICHNSHIVTHITVIFCQRQTGVDGSLSGSHRHIGGIRDQSRTVHQGMPGLRIHQFSEFFQNLCHLVSSLAAADIDDNICIGPLGDLMLGHGFPGTETTGDSGCTAFCDREHGIQDTLTGDQWLGCRETSFGRAGNADRPFLAQGQFLGGSVGKLQCDDRIQDGVSAIRGCFDNGSLHIRRNHGSMKDTCGFLGFCDDGSSGHMIALGDCHMNIPFFGGIQRINADTTGDIFAGAGSDLT